MSTPSADKRPAFYLSFEQVRDSGLLSPERLAELTAEIDRRLTTPFDSKGNPIETARLADLSPYPSYLYLRADRNPEDPWGYPRREILSVILTDEERELLNTHAFDAQRVRREIELFNKARKVPEGEWGDGVFHGDDYYSSTDDLYDA